MSCDNLEPWLSAAAAVTRVRRSFNPPLHVLLTEAIDLARFVQCYWEPRSNSTGAIERPGLCHAGSNISLQLARDLLQLHDAVHTAHTSYLLAIARPDHAERTRARAVLAELIAALTWCLRNATGDGAAQLAVLRSTHGRAPRSMHSLCAALADYTALAERHGEALMRLHCLAPTLLAEAAALTRSLRETRATPGTRDATRRALDLRNRLATLLLERMNHVRAAVRFVFRHYPAIIREATSAFERRRKAPRASRGAHLEKTLTLNHHG